MVFWVVTLSTWLLIPYVLKDHTIIIIIIIITTTTTTIRDEGACNCYYQEDLNPQHQCF